MFLSNVLIKAIRVCMLKSRGNKDIFKGFQLLSTSYIHVNRWGGLHYAFKILLYLQLRRCGYFVLELHVFSFNEQKHPH